LTSFIPFVVVVLVFAFIVDVVVIVTFIFVVVDIPAISYPPLLIKRKKLFRGTASLKVDLVVKFEGVTQKKIYLKIEIKLTVLEV
jgi:hypothetical protein